MDTGVLGSLTPDALDSDALAQYRATLGLPAQALAWGQDAAARHRGTVAPCPRTARARLLDAAAGGAPFLLPIGIDTRALAEEGHTDRLPRMLSSLIRTRSQPAADASTGDRLRESLSGFRSPKRIAS
ncbi:hypothetical protein [Streptomyces sp. 8N616]|uniref:hypothetical protein n=1 Tax=Streptomyces sp. 8N616 TaxID=3457414 RepID=UPI003FCFC909